MDKLTIIALLGGIFIMIPWIISKLFFNKKPDPPEEKNYNVGKLTATLYLKDSSKITFVFEGLCEQRVWATTHSIYQYYEVTSATKVYENWLADNKKTGFFNSGDNNYLPVDSIEVISTSKEDYIITKNC